MSTSDDGLYAPQSFGTSVLEISSVLGDVLRPAGYDYATIQDITIGIFLTSELENVQSASPIHILAMKKALLYAIPVIAPPKANKGIRLTSQVATSAIEYSGSGRTSTKATAIAIGDKYRLIGLAFPQSGSLVNHLSSAVFQFKYHRAFDKSAPIDLSHMREFEPKYTDAGTLFIIKPRYYENTDLFNEVNRAIANRLRHFRSVARAIADGYSSDRERLAKIRRITPMGNQPYLPMLNRVLVCQIDSSFTMSLYEALNMTGLRSLFDEIQLAGIESQSVKREISRLAYVKEQTRQMRSNERAVYLSKLENTRAEKICRERYPYYFDFTDRRVLFTRFKRFAIDRLPSKDRKEVAIVLKKELDAQQALLRNKCVHLDRLRELARDSDSIEANYSEVADLLNRNGIDTERMIPCRLCLYPLMCAHEVDFYDALTSVDKTHSSASDGDRVHWIRQKIINRYKKINKRPALTQETETRFMYYCRHCGGELGMSEDAIQSSMKTIMETSRSIDSSPIELIIYRTSIQTMSAYLVPSTVPTSVKSINRVVLDEVSTKLRTIAKSFPVVDDESTELMIRYTTVAYVLASLVVINATSLGSLAPIIQEPVRSESIRPSTYSKKSDEVRPEELSTVGGVKVQFKDEMVVALKIIRSIDAFKKIGITSDRVKALLMEAAKFALRVFSKESVQLIERETPRDRMKKSLASDPIAKYAQFMANRAGESNIDLETITGVDLDSLYPSKGKKTKTPPESHALFNNIYRAKRGKTESDQTKYMIDSYENIVEMASMEPIQGQFTSIVAAPVSDSMSRFQREQTRRIHAKRSTPMGFLPVENLREHDFRLRTFNVAYCNGEGDALRRHRWTATKSEKGVLSLTCKYCKVDSAKIDRKSHDIIEERLNGQMLLTAFFEFHTLVCPVKDGHVYGPDGKCERCGVTKAMLVARDPKYYKKFSGTYLKYRKSVTTKLLDSANAISKYPTAFVKKTSPSTPTKVDHVKLRSLATSLKSSLKIKRDVESLGIIKGQRSLTSVMSYVRTLYSYFTYLKNLSTHSIAHPDSSFMDFLVDNFYTGAVPKVGNVGTLPEYPMDSDADSLLVQLLERLYQLATTLPALAEFLLNKFVSQDSRHEEFNYRKLRATTTLSVSEDDDMPSNDDDDTEVVDMFDGYDIDVEDIEDNIDGEV